jgi:hypothetical protein
MQLWDDQILKKRKSSCQKVVVGDLRTTVSITFISETSIYKRLFL